MKIKSIVVFILYSLGLFGQVKNVSYELRFNPSTKFYDLSLIVNEGSAHDVKERIQFNAQVGLITPENTNLEIVKSYMPLVNNSHYKGNQPMKWEVSNYLRNAKELKNNYVYSVSPKLNQTSFYNDLKEGDKVLLFSLEVYPLPTDKSSVRLFSNKLDAASDKLDGGDFRNGFTLGSIQQLFSESGSTTNDEITIFDKNKFHSSVYPNPAVNTVNINLNTPTEEKVNITMYNSNGALVSKSLTSKSSGLTTISQSLDHVSPGIYTIKIDAMGEQQEHNIIVIKE